ncbi:uncharacterized protein LOC124413710 isoform X2 [Diprion similis]|uniref:uncharacterized protein LOC124413710 isoform X2 n=1 Tax=Diprion similis TaxID=362088 RepID=UPI001EF9B6B7|nr:uncharacterized protein LOC124413710 isoform X2 [Diprion similis]
MTAIFDVKCAAVLTFVYVLFVFDNVQEVVGDSLRNDDFENNCGGGANHTTTLESAIRWKRETETSGLRRPSPCPVPPQPSNGQWKLHRTLCDSNRECDVAQGLHLDPGSQLVYTCRPNYRIKGSTDVFCGVRGTWSEIPECIEIKCDALNSPSTIASCYNLGKLVSCDTAVSPGIRAQVSCRQGYRMDTSSLTSRRDIIVCTSNGTWEPDPIRCIPLCGVAIPNHTPLAYNAEKANVGDFPWHATLYKERNTRQGLKKEFSCGATIIHTNLVMTAAHCIYNENTKTTECPEKLFLLTGNTFRDYDSPLHDRRIVRQAEVKNVYVHCQYYGLNGNYATDIALLELKQPFELSSILQPACLDLSGYSQQILEPGVSGKVAGFGRTELGGTSAVLQTLTLPYISYSQCKSLKNNAEVEVFISNDKFCAGYTNGSAVCEGDSGGGLVFQKDDLWYVMGIVSVGLGVETSNGERTCDKNSYSLYTKVSTYMSWIQEVIFYLERYKSYQSCSSRIPSVPTHNGSVTPRPSVTPTPTSSSPTSATRPRPTRPTKTSTPDPTGFRIPTGSCRVPPQPPNGERRLHPALCEENADCSLVEGAALGPGSQLVYSCKPGFRMNGSTDVFCRLQLGKWSTIPTCIEITCPSLDSASMIATCYSQNQRKPCDSMELPNITASLACRPGYAVDPTLQKTSSKTVTCNINGEWEPNPITCLPVPVCGITNTHSTRTVLNGIVFDLPHFPWHAMVYKQKKASQDPKEFQCGATIIQDNLLLTAAHCVYDHVLKTVEIPEKFHVITGNKFRDYDSPLHDSRIVQKAAVKSIHIPCEYSGSQSNYYGSDIAIIELQKPFKLSGVSNPVCMDVLGTKERLVKSGSVGRLAGFGRTGSGPSTATLVTTNNPYIALSECTVSNNNEDKELTGNDKFCVGSGNGTDSCEGDSGGGLVFENDGNWYVMGVLSTSFRPSSGNGTCDGNATSLYTKVPAYMSWIRKVISSLERHQSFPPCKPSV